MTHPAVGGGCARCVQETKPKHSKRILTLDRDSSIKLCCHHNSTNKQMLQCQNGQATNAVQRLPTWRCRQSPTPEARPSMGRQPEQKRPQTSCRTSVATEVAENCFISVTAKTTSAFRLYGLMTMLSSCIVVFVQKHKWRRQATAMRQAGMQQYTM